MCIQARVIMPLNSVYDSPVVSTKHSYEYNDNTLYNPGASLFTLLLLGPFY